MTAKVVSHERGPKIRIGKYRRRTGYKRHNGFRAAITRIQIESIAGAAKAAPAKKAAAPKAETPKAETPKAEARRSRPRPRSCCCRRRAPVERPLPRRRAAGALPEGYDGFTVAQIQAGTGSWSAAELAAALAYEQEHAKRKGALAALTSAIEKEGDA